MKKFLISEPVKRLEHEVSDIMLTSTLRISEPEPIIDDLVRRYECILTICFQPESFIGASMLFIHIFNYLFIYL